MQTFRRPEFSAGFLPALAGAVLLLPLGWLFAAAAAAAFHELCHILALRICGGQVRDIRFTSRGAVIHAPPLSPARTLFCTLAGPLGSLLLLHLARQFPRLALCAAVQSFYNLLPISGLDGGHALSCILSPFLPPRSVEKICRTTEILILILIGILGLWGTFVLKLGLLPVLTAALLICKGRNGKIPCKSGPMRVQ